MNGYSAEMLAKMRQDELKGRIMRALKRNQSAQNEAYLKREYGISLNFVLNLMIAQEANCGLCQMSLEDRAWNVDHCHTQKRVRGLLCDKCNYWLGMNQLMVEQAFGYLRRTLSWVQEGTR